MRRSSNWAASRCSPTGSTTRRDGWKRAIALHPDDADAKVMLAEAFYRRDDFQKAAAALNGVEVSSNNADHRNTRR